ncbi:MAG: hypothetical protein ACRD3P_06560 [Terriglobales bacterium]
MNSMHYLYAAYIATWVIHGTYLTILVRKYSRIRKEMEKNSSALSRQPSAGT